MLARQALECPRWEYSFTASPGLSICSPLPATVCSGTQRLQCARQQSPSFRPHSPFIASLVSGERRVRGSWPSFLKCQAPWGEHATSVGLAHGCQSHRQIVIQPVLGGGHPWLSGLPWNQVTRIQPPVSREQSLQLSGAKCPGGRKDPYASEGQECQWLSKPQRPCPQTHPEDPQPMTSSSNRCGRL